MLPIGLHVILLPCLIKCFLQQRTFFLPPIGFPFLSLTPDVFIVLSFLTRGEFLPSVLWPGWARPTKFNSSQN